MSLSRRCTIAAAAMRVGKYDRASTAILLDEAAVRIAHLEAARERVRWILVGHGRRVASVGRSTFQLDTISAGVAFNLWRMSPSVVDLGIVSSLEAASSRIRAYRAGKWPKKGAR